MDAILHNTKIRAVFGGLRREDAILMVEEMFVNQLELKQIKKAIYQTKFWPKYGRDKVYSSGGGWSSGSSWSSSFSTVSASHYAPPPEGWFEIPLEEPELLSTTESQSVHSGEGDFESSSWSFAEADIPIFIPVPFEELSSLEYWSLDEVKWQMSEALKGQFPRHCFIQIPGQKTQPMLVSYVKNFYVSKEDVEEYEQSLYEKTGALSRAEVDRLIAEERRMLEQRAEEFVSLDEIPELDSRSMRSRR